MKKLTTIAAMLFCMSAPAPSQNNLAATTQTDGVYIFTDSSPVQEFTVIGVVRQSFFSEYHHTRNRLVRKAKKKYPGVEGIIIITKWWGADEALVITFKTEGI